MASGWHVVVVVAKALTASCVLVMEAVVSSWRIGEFGVLSGGVPLSLISNPMWPDAGAAWPSLPAVWSVSFFLLSGREEEV